MYSTAQNLYRTTYISRNLLGAIIVQTVCFSELRMLPGERHIQGKYSSSEGYHPRRRNIFRTYSCRYVTIGATSPNSDLQQPTVWPKTNVYDGSFPTMALRQAQNLWSPVASRENNEGRRHRGKQEIQTCECSTATLCSALMVAAPLANDTTCCGIRNGATNRCRKVVCGRLIPFRDCEGACRNPFGPAIW
jgi:hypothetical protein